MDSRTLIGSAGLALVVTGLFVGLRPAGLCGSPFLPAVDPSGGGCAALLDSPRLLAGVLVGLGLVVALGALAQGRRRALARSGSA
jgi:hypothetical protein